MSVLLNPRARGRDANGRSYGKCLLGKPPRTGERLAQAVALEGVVG